MNKESITFKIHHRIAGRRLKKEGKYHGQAGIY